MIRKILLSTLLLISVVAHAQEATYSPYSLNGIGITKFRGAINSVSMAGLSIVSDPVTPSILNPATYADLKFTNFSVGGTYSTGTIKSSTAESKGSTTSFDYLTISIPTNKFGFGFGLLPVSASGYRIDRKVEGATESLTGKGGVNRIYFGAGSEIYKGLKIGAEFRYNFGRIENEVVRFNDDSNITNTRNTNQTDVSGVSYALSAIYDRAVDDKHRLRYSVSYELSNKIKFDNNQISTEVFRNQTTGVITPTPANDFQRIEVPNRSFKLPSRLTLGTAYSKQGYWLIGGELFFGNNNDFQDRFETRDDVRYVNSSGFKLGGYFQPDYQSLSSYFERIIYRGGIRFEKTGLELNNEDINEFGISFGMSLPLQRGYSTIDVGFEAGQRGTTNSGAIEENFLNFSLGLNLSDKWFKKRKYD